jgi:peroxidase
MHVRSKRLSSALTILLIASGTVLTTASPAHAALGFEVQSLDGSGNNRAHPNWGKVGQIYPRVAAANYADGRGAPVAGPNVRAVSNRVIQDLGQNIFSEHRVTQWGWTWGQFLDHTFGLVDGAGESANIPFDSTDPTERFSDTLGVIPFTRSRPAPGTGVGNPRQQINTVSGYIDAWAVYGGTNSRLEWLRDGSVDGNVADNSAKLMLPGGYLPRRSARGDTSSAPEMALDGRLTGHPDQAMVAGDVRANENIALTATHTLFAREHNRIVSLLPNSLSNEEKFQIARRIVIAEQQYITYNEFLPAMGVSLPMYAGYNPNVNATLTDEFATIGYRAHSQIHGEFEIEVDASTYTQADLDALEAAGVEVTVAGDEVTLGVSLNLAFFNPDLLAKLKLGPMLKGIGGEPQYNNDEQIDDHLRSVLFQVPVSGNPGCLSDPSLPACFNGVVDLGAIDIQRGRDHGMPTYNQLRQAYGLAPKTDFKSITGESSEAFPPGTDVNDPASLDFTNLYDINGNPVPLGSDDSAFMTKGVRRTPLAARLKAVYGSVDKVDGFAGMISEKHVPGTEFGELQLAIWTRQFQALRDGDRFFYGNDPGLSMIRSTYGIDYHRTLAQLIAANTDIPAADLNDDVFLVADDDIPAATCSVTYHVDSTWSGEYQVSLAIKNLTNSRINGWTVGWQFPAGQNIRLAWNSVASQRGNQVSVANPSWNTSIPAGGTVTDAGFIGRWDNTTNPAPTNITLNNRRCARG